MDAAELLFRAGSALFRSVDRDALFREVGRVAVPLLGDWCFIDLLERGAWRPQCRVCADPVDEARADELRGVVSDAPRAFSREGGLRGATFVVVDDELQRASRRRARGLALLRDRGVRTYLRVPFSGGSAIGVITFAALADARQGPGSLRLAQQLSGLVGQALDMQERVRAAERAIRDRDQFLSSIAHDLSNPLTALRLRCEILHRQLKGHQRVPREAIVERLVLTIGNATAMCHLVEGLLDTARVQSGRMLDLDRRRVDLAALTRRAIQERKLIARRHEFQLEADGGAIQGNWDGDRLVRVLDNLLGNAVKYSPGGGVIRVEIRREQDHTGVWAVLCVRDHGIGIPAEDLPRVFDMFARGSNAFGRTLGHGVGLASARQIVEQHGGTIAVRSELGSGATFEVRLPLDSAAHHT